MAVNRDNGDLYYFRDNGLFRLKYNCAESALLLTALSPGLLEIEPSLQTLYWRTSQGPDRSAHLDGSEVRDVTLFDKKDYDLCLAAGFDPAAKKFYWGSNSKASIRRQNLDGSQPEDVVVNIPGKIDFDIDVECRQIYWLEHVTSPEGKTVARIRRAAIPEFIEKVELPPPPLIASVAPPTLKPSETITVCGTHFSATQAVWLFDDASGEHRVAEFTVVDDGTISFTVPPLNKRCRHPLLAVVTPSGVTVGMPSDPKRARPHLHEVLHRYNLHRGFAWVLPKDSWLNIEVAVVLAEEGGTVSPGPYGHNVYLLKKGASATVKFDPDPLVFYEEGAHLEATDEQMKAALQVPAIRPSYLDSVLSYHAAK